MRKVTFNLLTTVTSSVNSGGLIIKCHILNNENVIFSQTTEMKYIDSQVFINALDNKGFNLITFECSENIRIFNINNIVMHYDN